MEPALWAVAGPNLSLPTEMGSTPSWLRNFRERDSNLEYKSLDHDHWGTSILKYALLPDNFLALQFP